MCVILSEWIIGKYAILELDQDPPMRHYRRYRIEGVEYDPVPVYDLPRQIAVEAQGSFKGKSVEFI
ncbi:MAG: hypothetical protein J6B85_05970 [Lachnospiraceae bacterium]|nr:hypothetical protein [Lachnospiraceae bacterium]